MVNLQTSKGTCLAPRRAPKEALHGADTSMVTMRKLSASCSPNELSGRGWSWTPVGLAGLAGRGGLGRGLRGAGRPYQLRRALAWAWPPGYGAAYKKPRAGSPNPQLPQLPKCPVSCGRPAPLCSRCRRCCRCSCRRCTTRETPTSWWLEPRSVSVSSIPSLSPSFDPSCNLRGAVSSADAAGSQGLPCASTEPSVHLHPSTGPGGWPSHSRRRH